MVLIVLQEAYCAVWISIIMRSCSSTPTVEIIMTLSIAITLLVAVFFIGFLSHKLMLLAAFIPAGTPLGLVPLMIVLEILAYVTRTLSLGMR